MNAGPSRFYQFFLTKDGKDQAFVQIGNDESLLEQPYGIPPHDGILVAVAERADVVIDFGRYKKGDKLFFVNRLVMTDEGFGPALDNAGKFKILPEGEGDPILCFEVGGDAADSPPIPTNYGQILICRNSPKRLRRRPQKTSKSQRVHIWF